MISDHDRHEFQTAITRLLETHDRNQVIEMLETFAHTIRYNLMPVAAPAAAEVPPEAPAPPKADPTPAPVPAKPAAPANGIPYFKPRDKTPAKAPARKRVKK